MLLQTQEMVGGWVAMVVEISGRRNHYLLKIAFFLQVLWVPQHTLLAFLPSLFSKLWSLADWFANPLRTGAVESFILQLN